MVTKGLDEFDSVSELLSVCVCLCDVNVNVHISHWAQYVL